MNEQARKRMLGVHPIDVSLSHNTQSTGSPIRTCLLVDDSRYDRQIVMRLARSAGLELNFLEMTNLESARAVLQTEAIDLVIVDYNLPDGTGLELAKDVFEGILSIKTPLILLTGQGSEQIVSEAFDNGCMAYLSKSDLSSEILESCVQRSFAHFAAGRLLSVRTAQKIHNSKSVEHRETSELLVRLEPNFQRLRRQLRGLRTDLQTGNSTAALAQILLLEEAMESVRDVCSAYARHDQG